MHQVALEAELREETDEWREGYVVRLYPDTRAGLQRQAQEESILGREVSVYEEGDENGSQEGAAHQGIESRPGAPRSTPRHRARPAR